MPIADSRVEAEFNGGAGGGNSGDGGSGTIDLDGEIRGRSGCGGECFVVSEDDLGSVSGCGGRGERGCCGVCTFRDNKCWLVGFG